MLGGSLAAEAQQPYPLRVPAPERMSENTIQVSVNYSFSVPVKGADETAQAEALESGRKLIYGIAASECKVLETTIASACRLERLNVQSNTRRNARSEDQPVQIQVGGNASYRIQLK
jgi:hypothetical protein